MFGFSRTGCGVRKQSNLERMLFAFPLESKLWVFGAFPCIEFYTPGKSPCPFSLFICPPFISRLPLPTSMWHNHLPGDFTHGYIVAQRFRCTCQILLKLLIREELTTSQQDPNGLTFVNHSMLTCWSHQTYSKNCHLEFAVVPITSRKSIVESSNFMQFQSWSSPSGFPLLNTGFGTPKPHLLMGRRTFIHCSHDLWSTVALGGYSYGLTKMDQHDHVRWQDRWYKPPCLQYVYWASNFYQNHEKSVFKLDVGVIVVTAHSAWWSSGCSFELRQQWM